jgi:hypothetical protein
MTQYEILPLLFSKAEINAITTTYTFLSSFLKKVISKDLIMFCKRFELLFLTFYFFCKRIIISFKERKS